MNTLDGGESLTNLNGNPKYDFVKTSELYFENDDFPNPYSTTNIDSTYYDLSSFKNNFAGNSNSLFISLNIQSLNSKIDSLKILVSQLISENINLEIVALQEIWQITHPDLYQIPGFNFVYLQRSFGRGGGVGFYVRDSLTFKSLPNLCFSENVIEYLTLEI